MNRFFAWLFDRDDSRTARSAKFGSVAILLGLAVTVLMVATWRPDPPEPVARTRAKARPRPETADAAPQPSVERTTPVPVSTANEVAQSMDLTTVRHHVARLRMAAATGDASGRESALRSLARYGRSIQSLLGDEIAREPDPVVRTWLGEARNSLK